MPVVLAVEDEGPLQDLVHDTLKAGGFALFIAASAEEALTLFQSGVVKYSALVTDVNLNGTKTGWDLARQIREINGAFPVIYMTGAAADEWGSQGVLQKPFAPRWSPPYRNSSTPTLVNLSAPVNSDNT